MGGGVFVPEAGDGDKESFLRLRKRAERSVSGVACFGASKMGLDLSRGQ